MCACVSVLFTVYVTVLDAAMQSVNQAGDALDFVNKGWAVVVCDKCLGLFTATGRPRAVECRYCSCCGWL